jgi:hypothetical protein
MCSTGSEKMFESDLPRIHFQERRLPEASTDPRAPEHSTARSGAFVEACCIVSLFPQTSVHSSCLFHSS